MKFKVVEPFRVKTSGTETLLNAGQLITLPTGKALKLLNEGKIIPAERVAYRVFSEILQAFLWVVYGPEDMAALRARGIIEAIYTGQEITALRKLPKEALRTIHEAKEIFPGSRVEEVKHESK
ncbi:MAG: hypothetical protein M0Z71_00870 [Nitrospiraceae bacterium]|nr:hypothetical protein [Nitrospiraceae bacterium]